MENTVSILVLLDDAAARRKLRELEQAGKSGVDYRVKVDGQAIAKANKQIADGVTPPPLDLELGQNSLTDIRKEVESRVSGISIDPSINTSGLEQASMAAFSAGFDRAIGSASLESLEAATKEAISAGINTSFKSQEIDFFGDFDYKELEESLKEAFEGLKGGGLISGLIGNAALSLQQGVGQGLGQQYAKGISKALEEANIDLEKLGQNATKKASRIGRFAGDRISQGLGIEEGLAGVPGEIEKIRSLFNEVFDEKIVSRKLSVLELQLGALIDSLLKAKDLSEVTSTLPKLAGNLADVAAATKDVAAGVLFDEKAVAQKLSVLESQFGSLIDSLREIKELSATAFDFPEVSSNFAGVAAATKDVVVGAPAEGVKRRRDRILREVALPQALQRAEEIDARPLNVPEGAKSVVFGIGGFAGTKGQSGEAVAEKLQLLTGKENPVIPVQNPNTDIDASFADSKLRFLLDALKKLVEINVTEGFNPDAVEAAAQAIAVQQQTGLPVGFAGYSAGGLVAEEAAALLKLAGRDAKAVGIGTPRIGNTANASDYFDVVLGEQDLVASLGKQGEVFEQGGASHKLADYLGHLDTQLAILEKLGVSVDRAPELALLETFEIPDLSKNVSALLEEIGSISDDPEQIEALKESGAGRALLNRIAKYRDSIRRQVAESVGATQDYLETVDRQLARTEKATRTIFGLRGKVAEPAVGLTREQRANFAILANEAAVPRENLPSLRIDDQALDSLGTDAFFDVEKNQLLIRKEAAAMLASDVEDIEGQQKILASLINDLSRLPGGAAANASAVARARKSFVAPGEIPDPFLDISDLTQEYLEPSSFSFVSPQASLSSKPISRDSIEKYNAAILREISRLLGGDGKGNREALIEQILAADLADFNRAIGAIEPFIEIGPRGGQSLNLPSENRPIPGLERARQAEKRLRDTLLVFQSLEGERREQVARIAIAEIDKTRKALEKIAARTQDPRARQAIGATRGRLKGLERDFLGELPVAASPEVALEEVGESVQESVRGLDIDALVGSIPDFKLDAERIIQDIVQTVAGIPGAAVSAAAEEAEKSVPKPEEIAQQVKAAVEGDRESFLQAPDLVSAEPTGLNVDKISRQFRQKVRNGNFDSERSVEVRQRGAEERLSKEDIALRRNVERLLRLANSGNFSQGDFAAAGNLLPSGQLALPFQGATGTTKASEKQQIELRRAIADLADRAKKQGATPSDVAAIVQELRSGVTVEGVVPDSQLPTTEIKITETNAEAAIQELVRLTLRAAGEAIDSLPEVVGIDGGESRIQGGQFLVPNELLGRIRSSGTGKGGVNANEAKELAAIVDRDLIQVKRASEASAENEKRLSARQLNVEAVVQQIILAVADAAGVALQELPAIARTQALRANFSDGTLNIPEAIIERLQRGEIDPSDIEALTRAVGIQPQASLRPEVLEASTGTRRDAPRIEAADVDRATFSKDQKTLQVPRATIERIRRGELQNQDVQDIARATRAVSRQDDLLKLSPSETDRFGKAVEARAAGTSDRRKRQKIRAEEADSTAFASRVSPDVREAILRREALAQFEDSFGLGGSRAELAVKTAELGILEQVSEEALGYAVDLSREVEESREAIATASGRISSAIAEARNVEILPADEILQLQDDILSQVEAIQSAFFGELSRFKERAQARPAQLKQEISDQLNTFDPKRDIEPLATQFGVQSFTQEGKRRSRREIVNELVENADLRELEPAFRQTAETRKNRRKRRVEIAQDVVSAPVKAERFVAEKAQSAISSVRQATDEVADGFLRLRDALDIEPVNKVTNALGLLALAGQEAYGRLADAERKFANQFGVAGNTALFLKDNVVAPALLTGGAKALPAVGGAIEAGLGAIDLAVGGAVGAGLDAAGIGAVEVFSPTAFVPTEASGGLLGGVTNAFENATGALVNATKNLTGEVTSVVRAEANDAFNSIVREGAERSAKALTADAEVGLARAALTPGTSPRALPPAVDRSGDNRITATVTAKEAQASIKAISEQIGKDIKSLKQRVASAKAEGRTAQDEVAALRRLGDQVRRFEALIAAVESDLGGTLSRGQSRSLSGVRGSLGARRKTIDQQITQAESISQVSSKSAGESTVDGITKGIRERSADPADAIELVAEAAIDSFKKALGIASPAKEMVEPGRNVVQGVVVGIESEIGSASEAMKDAFEGLSEESRQAVKEAIEAEELAFEADLKVKGDDKSVFSEIGGAVQFAVDHFKRLEDAAHEAHPALGALFDLAKGGVVAFVGFELLQQATQVLGNFTSQSLEAALALSRLETALDFSAGSSISGAASLKFVREEAERLNIPLSSAQDGFKGLATATRNTALEGGVTQEVFSGLSAATAVLGLDQETAGRAFAATQQIISKGKLSAEELRQQLSEALPGSFQIGARALGISEAELNRRLELGQVSSQEFIPKFAQQLQQEFGPGAEAAANSAQGAVNEFSNATLKAQESFGKLLQPAQVELLQAASGAIGFVAENMDLLGVAAIALGARLVDSLLSPLGGIPGAAGKAASSLGTLLSEGISSLTATDEVITLSDLGEGAKSRAKTAGSQIKEGFGAFVSSATSVPSRLSGARDSLLSGPFDFAQALPERSAAAVKGFQGSIGSAAKAATAINFAPAIVGAQRATGAVLGFGKAAIQAAAPMLAIFGAFEGVRTLGEVLGLSELAQGFREAADAAEKNLQRIGKAGEAASNRPREKQRKAGGFDLALGLGGIFGLEEGLKTDSVIRSTKGVLGKIPGAKATGAFVDRFTPGTLGSTVADLQFTRELEQAVRAEGAGQDTLLSTIEDKENIKQQLEAVLGVDQQIQKLTNERAVLQNQPTQDRTALAKNDQDLRAAQRRRLEVAEGLNSRQADAGQLLRGAESQLQAIEAMRESGDISNSEADVLKEKFEGVRNSAQATVDLFAELERNVGSVADPVGRLLLAFEKINLELARSRELSEDAFNQDRLGAVTSLASEFSSNRNAQQDSAVDEAIARQQKAQRDLSIARRSLNRSAEEVNRPEVRQALEAVTTPSGQKITPESNLADLEIAASGLSEATQPREKQIIEQVIAYRKAQREVVAIETESQEAVIGVQQALEAQRLKVIQDGTAARQSQVEQAIAQEQAAINEGLRTRAISESQAQVQLADISVATSQEKVAAAEAELAQIREAAAQKLLSAEVVAQKELELTNTIEQAKAELVQNELQREEARRAAILETLDLANKRATAEIEISQVTRTIAVQEGLVGGDFSQADAGLATASIDQDTNAARLADAQRRLKEEQRLEAEGVRSKREAQEQQIALQQEIANINRDLINGEIALQNALRASILDTLSVRKQEADLLQQQQGTSTLRAFASGDITEAERDLENNTASRQKTETTAAAAREALSEIQSDPNLTDEESRRAQLDLLSEIEAAETALLQSQIERQQILRDEIDRTLSKRQAELDLISQEQSVERDRGTLTARSSGQPFDRDSFGLAQKTVEIGQQVSRSGFEVDAIQESIQALDALGTKDEATQRRRIELQGQLAAAQKGAIESQIALLDNLEQRQILAIERQLAAQQRADAASIRGIEARISKGQALVELLGQQSTLLAAQQQLTDALGAAGAANLQIKDRDLQDQLADAEKVGDAELVSKIEKKRLGVAVEIADQRIKAERESIALAKQQLELELQRERIAARIAAQEAEIARLRAQSGVNQAQGALSQARVEGDSEKIASAKEQLAIAQQEVSLTSQQTALAKENLNTVEKAATLRRNAFDVQSDTSLRLLDSERDSAVATAKREGVRGVGGSSSSRSSRRRGSGDAGIEPAGGAAAFGEGISPDAIADLEAKLGQISQVALPQLAGTLTSLENSTEGLPEVFTALGKSVNLAARSLQAITKIPGRYAGGPVHPNQQFWIAENGPEILDYGGGEKHLFSQPQLVTASKAGTVHAPGITEQMLKWQRSRESLAAAGSLAAISERSTGSLNASAQAIAKLSGIREIPVRIQGVGSVPVVSQQSTYPTQNPAVQQMHQTRQTAILQQMSQRLTQALLEARQIHIHGDNQADPVDLYARFAHDNLRRLI